MRPSVLGEREITQRLMFLKALCFWQTRNPIRPLEDLLTHFTSVHLNAVDGRLRCISWKYRIFRHSFQVCFTEHIDLWSTRSKGTCDG